MRRIPWLISAMVILIAGCVTIISTNGNLKIGANEKWDLKLELEIPANEVQAYGAYLTQSLNEFVQEAKAKGVQGNWSQKGPNNEGNVTYTISFSGTGFDKFNSIINSAQLTTSEQNGKQVVHFYMAPLDIGLSRSTSFELIGGNILQTNGAKVNSTTVRWNQAMVMEAVMEPPSSSGITVFWIFVGILLVVGFLGNRAGWFRKPPALELRSFNFPSNDQSYPTQRTQPEITSTSIQSSTPIAADLAVQQTDNGTIEIQGQPVVEHFYCPNCGAPWVKNARFCNRCGFRG